MGPTGPVLPADRVLVLLFLLLLLRPRRFLGLSFVP